MARSSTMRPLRIVQVSTIDIGGGAEKVAFSLHHMFRSMGHESRLVVRTKHGTDPDVLEIDSSARASGRVRLKVRLERTFGWQDLDHPGSHRLVELLGEPWDVLHVHNLHGGYFDLAALPALSRRAPTVLMMHDNWLQTGHCAYHFDCERWKTGCGECPDLAIYPAIRSDGTRFNWMRKQLFLERSSVHITAPSQWLLDEAAQSMLADKPMRLVHNGVDREIFAPGSRGDARAELGLPQGVPLIVFAALGSLENPFKDGRTLLAALAELVQALPEVRLLALGGTTIPPGFEALHGAIIARPFDPDPRRMAACYRAGDVYAHATRVDNAPLSIIEAMACGLPVVASAVGGIAEYVVDGQTGLLVAPRDPKALAAALRRILEDPAMASSMGSRGAAVARDRYDLRDQARSYLAWYDELRSAPAVAGRG